MIRFFRSLLFVLCLGQQYAYADNDYVIEIFTQEDLYPANKFSIYRNNPYPKFTVTRISNILDIEKAMSNGLPGVESQAIDIAKQQIKQYQQEITRAWQNNTAIHRYRLTQLPAIVFNQGEAVWYGGRLDLALQAYTAFLEAK